MSHEALFQPGRIGNLEIPNRILKSPQATATANLDGTVSQRTVNHYRRLGEGGVGLVMVEYSYVDDDASKSIHNQIGNTRREHTAGLGWLADEVHSTGAKVGLQLAHCGRQRFLGTAPMKSASDSSWDVAEMPFGVTPQPMTLDEIDGVVRAFGEAAMRTYLARFDLVEVHAGHGYLITNFLSPHTNKRTDQYGGSFENRSRLLLRIVDEIRATVPRDFPLSVRVSVTDYEQDGIPVAETVALCKLLEQHGVDVIHASGGHHALMEWEVSPWYQPRAPHRWGWEKIKPEVSIPVIGSGSLVSPDLAADVIGSGSADFVSLGRAMLADPDWARKAEQGRVLEITPCIRCNDGCLHRGLNAGRSTGCSVNPNQSEEGRFPVVPAEQSKNVAVIGGGPAGLRSAALLHDRGHRVTLFEPDELGGLLNHAVGSTIKQDIAGLAAHLTHEVLRRNIQIVPKAAGKAEIVAAGAEAVVIATGAPQREPDFPVDAAAPVLRASEVRAATPLKGRVVVIGGGLQGCEAARRIAEMPDTVVVVLERGDQLISNDEVVSDQHPLPEILNASGVEIRTGVTALAVTPEGVQVSAVGGQEQVLPVDHVVLALGREAADTTLTDELRAEGLDVHVVGSAIKPGRVFDAIHTAFFTSRLV